MIKRYSGQLTIEMTLTPVLSLYQITIRGPNAVWRSAVTPPDGPLLESNEVYDQVASIALSQLSDEEDRGMFTADLIQYSDWDIDGPFVSRTRLEAA